jgi:hypothetical protein
MYRPKYANAWSVVVREFVLFYCVVHIVASISTNTEEFMAALSSLPASPPIHPPEALAR